MKHRILVIDDVQSDLEALKIFLEAHGYLVNTTTDVDEGIAYVRQNRGKLSLVMVEPTPVTQPVPTQPAASQAVGQPALRLVVQS